MPSTSRFLRESGWLGGVVLALAGFVALNAALSGVSTLRLDLTEDRLYTLSDGTRQVLEELPEPATLTLYYSERLGQELPFYGNYAARVRDLLREFAAAGGERLTVEVKDPEPFSVTEDEAVEAGLQGAPLDAGGETVYFGLVGRLGDRADALAFLQPDRERFLEYDIARMLSGLANPRKPKLGVISNKEVFGSVMAFQQGQEPQPWVAMEQIRESFETVQIWSDDDLIREDPDVLMLIHPHGLDDDLLYALDQYMLRGGRAVLFHDPWNESDAGRPPNMMSMPGASTSDLGPLLAAWGVTVSDGEIAADRTLGRMVNAGTDAEVVPAPYVAWIQPGPEQFNADDPIVADLPQLILPSPGFIALVDEAPLEMIPLIRTSQDAMAVSTDKLADPDVLALAAEFEPRGEPFVVAARLHGSVPSAFPDGPPVAEEDPAGMEDTEAPDEVAGEAEAEDGAITPPPETAPPETVQADEAEADENTPAPPHLSRSEAPLSIVLIADADMLEDRFWVQVQSFFGQRLAVPFAGNGALALNAAEALSGTDALLSLRTRGQSQRPFTRIQELQRAAEAEHRAEEQRLRDQLAETEERLSALQAEEATAEAQEEELRRFTEELLAIRQQLRDVTFQLRRDIEDLQTRLTVINVGLMPALVALFAIGLGLARLNRRRTR